MAGWRRLVVAALLQLAFSRALPTENGEGIWQNERDTSQSTEQGDAQSTQSTERGMPQSTEATELSETDCYKRGELSQGSGYFDCSEPRLNFNDTSRNLTMDIRNRNNKTVCSLSLSRTADAFHIITLKDNVETTSVKQFDLQDSSSALHLNIDRSSVKAKTHGKRRKLDIPETDEIFSLYFRSYPPNPAFCITCNGEDIWQDERDTSQSTEQGDAQSAQSTEQDGEDIWQNERDTSQSTEQRVVQSTQSTEQGKLWPLCFILLPILGLLLYKRKHLCGKMQLLRQAIRTCCHKTNEATTESEQEMPGYFPPARREETGTVHVKDEFKAGQVVGEEVEIENDIYISADHFQRSEAGQVVSEEVETENDVYISGDHFQRGEAEEYETVNDIYVSVDVHHFGNEEYETVNDIHVS